MRATTFDFDFDFDSAGTDTTGICELCAGPKERCAGRLAKADEVLFRGDRLCLRLDQAPLRAPLRKTIIAERPEGFSRGQLWREMVRAYYEAHVAETLHFCAHTVRWSLDEMFVLGGSVREKAGEDAVLTPVQAVWKQQKSNKAATTTTVPRLPSRHLEALIDPGE